MNRIYNNLISKIFLFFVGIKQQGIKLGDVDVNEGENRIKVYSLGIHDTLAASLDAKSK